MCGRVFTPPSRATSPVPSPGSSATLHPTPPPRNMIQTTRVVGQLNQRALGGEELEQGRCARAACEAASTMMTLVELKLRGWPAE